MWAPCSALSAARPPKQCISVLFFPSVTRLEPRLYLRYPTLLYIVRYFMYIQCIRRAATRGMTPRAVLESLQVVVSRCCPPCGSKTHDARLLPWYSFRNSFRSLSSRNYLRPCRSASNVFRSSPSAAGNTEHVVKSPFIA